MDPAQRSPAGAAEAPPEQAAGAQGRPAATPPTAGSTGTPGRPLPPTAFGVGAATGAASVQRNSTNPYGSAGMVAPRQVPTIGTGPGPIPPMTSQPFANFTPGPALSPYINLFRNDRRFGAVNNYYSLVRPMLQQQQLNQQTDQSLRELRIQNRLQQSQLQQLNSQMPGAQGSTFMNYGGYFPGLGR
jgi:hypothetical protein